MRIVIQRVTNACIDIEGTPSGSIGRGFVVLFGVSQTDTKEIADKMLKKLVGLRIFDDEAGKTNLALADVGGEIMFVSQFTLYADCRKGNRPSFTSAGAPAMAEELYDYAVERLRNEYAFRSLVTGSFGAHMSISLTNDGPFTVVLDSDEIVK